MTTIRRGVTPRPFARSIVPRRDSRRNEPPEPDRI